jgi:large subunit ribosomal protein L15
MVVYKRKKYSRQRGSHTHGWGAMKKHRGAGNRGGRGNAGSGKRSDCKKPRYWVDQKYYGKHGFIKKNIKFDVTPVNIGYLEEHLNNFMKEKKVMEENGVYVVDLKVLGYNKLLSTGKLTKKFKITADFASSKAIEKVKQAGGEVIIKTA